MKKRHLLGILYLVLLLSGLSPVQASPLKTPVKAWQSVPIIETGFSTSGMSLALKNQALSPRRLHRIGLTSAHLQLSPSMTLKFDYTAMAQKTLKHAKNSIQHNGFRLGLLVRFY